MGQYLIPNAVSINEAVDYIGGTNIHRTWEYVEDGINFVDAQLSDAQCANLYQGYVPSGLTDEQYKPPLPPDVEQAKQTMKAFYNQNPASITDAQSATLNRAIVTWLRWRNRELEQE